jgi:peptide methionine sulfoxide reductase MsrA
VLFRLGSADGPVGHALGHAALARAPNHEIAYFGCGCFWHVQHDLVTSIERAVLGRSADGGLSAFTGYAGGLRASADGKVCYHSGTLLATADYGQLGHAEVVSLSLNVTNAAVVARVAQIFFDSTCVGGVRRDTQDWGSEYRSLIGLPGGLGSPAAKAFQAAAARRGIALKEGQGGDPDLRGVVYVMDTAQFPFYQAETYHQFHNDMSEAYGAAYNALRARYEASGAIAPTGCPRDHGSAGPSLGINFR